MFEAAERMPAEISVFFTAIEMKADRPEGCSHKRTHEYRTETGR
jgi:hypothetical protein